MVRTGVRVIVLYHLISTWPLPGRDSQEREQKEIPGLVWECFSGSKLIETHLLYNLEVDFI